MSKNPAPNLEELRTEFDAAGKALRSCKYRKAGGDEIAVAKARLDNAVQAYRAGLTAAASQK